MLRQEDLDAAVAEAIVTQAQAQALRDFAAKRERARDALLGHEERFRFMRGFTDFFFATGVAMLGAGMVYFAGLGTIFQAQIVSYKVIDGDLRHLIALISAGNLIAAMVTWALAELLVARMRLVLPGILLTCFFVVFAYRAVPVDLLNLAPSAPSQRNTANWVDFVFAGPGEVVTPALIALKALVAASAAALFYARFRLPFALLPVAAGAVMTVTAATREVGGPAAQPVVLLLCGLGVFAAAMNFDMSDRERLTRRADCAFWLHLLAAPLIVHSLLSMIVPGVTMTSMTAAVALEIVAIAILLALVAVVIDRRALLVSTFSYLGIVIAYALTTARATAPADESAVFFSTLAVLGTLVLMLGVGWQPLRRGLMSLLPTAAVDRLPPAVQPA
jgi:hypothetical protein